jgi:hypothetical protein
MSGRVLAAAAARRFLLLLVLLAAVLGIPAQRLLAASCSVVKHNPPTDADKAFLAADFTKAENLFRTGLAAHPGDVDLTAGLIHTLLREQKVQEAADAVKTALAANANSAPLLTLRGEVEFRQGEPWVVEQTVLASYKLDPCNPRTRLLFARFATVNSRYATARQQIQIAHQFDPEDPEIRAAWIQTLPLKQRIAEEEALLATSTGNDADVLRQMHTELDRWKKQVSEPARTCQLVSKTTAAGLPFIRLMARQHPRAYGLDVGLNGNSTRLQLGGGEGGLTVYRAVAERAGLKRITPSEPGAYPGAKPTYVAYAETIKVGDLEFQNCPVTVIDAGNPNDDGDGNIGSEVFSDFLVTFDYQMRKMQLGPLPPRPAEASAPAPRLRTVTGWDGESADSASVAYDRFIAPEMKDYTQAYRVGNSVILPAIVNGAKVKLFNLDMNLDLFAPTTDIALGVAKEVSKVYEKDFGGAKVSFADDITFNFARMSQKLNGVNTTDTGMTSKNAGMELSGSIGRDAIKLLILHVDYRDGLVKFEYIPDRGSFQ